MKTVRWFTAILLLLLVLVALFLLRRTFDNPQPARSARITQGQDPALRNQPGLAGLRQKLGLPQTKGTKAKAMDGEALIKGWIDANTEANQRFLNLSPEETIRLENDFIEFVEIKAELESRLIKVRSFDGKTLTVQVPSYPEDGRVIRNMFNAELKNDFPDGKYEQIDDHLGNGFDSYFRGFGIMDQTAVVTKDPATPDKYIIQWSATTVGDLTPSGVPSDYRMTGLKGTAVLTLDQIGTGEFGYLTTAITTNFEAGK